MNKKKLYIFLIFILVVSVKLYAQGGDPEDPTGWDDPQGPGGDIPIPGILYFLLALLGVGFKKIYNARKKS